MPIKSNANKVDWKKNSDFQNEISSYKANSILHQLKRKMADKKLQSEFHNSKAFEKRKVKKSKLIPFTTDFDLNFNEERTWFI